MAVLELDNEPEDDRELVGPIIRNGHLAEAVIDAVEADNPDSDVLVMSRTDYVRIHTTMRCRLTQASLDEAYGSHYPLHALEIDMPSFKGRMKTSNEEYVWFYNS